MNRAVIQVNSDRDHRLYTLQTRFTTAMLYMMNHAESNSLESHFVNIWKGFTSTVYST